MATFDDLCSIPTDPDISGIGVRAAIYIQNLLSFFPAIGFLWDREVSPFELEAVESQSTTILITAFAILTSAMVDARTIGLSTLHANIILGLSWMNNTNTFIYFLLYVQHKSQDGRGQVHRSWRGWMIHFKNEFRSTLAAGPTVFDAVETPKQKYRATARVGALRRSSTQGTLFTKIVLILGSLHLSMMAALGIWLWQDLGSFGPSTQCASTVILGNRVPVASHVLRIASLVIYSFFLLPVLNLVLPMVFFLGLFLYYHARRDSAFDGHDSEPSILPTVLGMFCLCAVNVIFIIDIELALLQNRARQTGSEESEWTFGQILAMLLLVLPLWDLFNAAIAHRHTASLKDALREQLPTDTILHLVTQPGADINTRARDAKFRTLLHLVVSRGDKTLVKVLLRLGADANMQVHNVLNTVSQRKYFKIWRLLVEHGADPTGEHFLDKFSPSAAGSGNKEILNAFLDMGTVAQISLALHWASYHGKVEVVQELLARGADPASQDQNGVTPLHTVSSKGQLDILQLLLRNTKHVNVKDNGGRTALHAAAYRGHMHTVRLLLEKGANPNIPDQSGVTALHTVSSNGQLDILKLLLRKTENVDVKDNGGHTALHAAAYRGHADTVRLLLKNDANPNIPDKKEGVVAEKAKGGADWTPLQGAVAQGHAEIVELLLAHNADPNFAGLKDATALQTATSQGRLDIVGLLLDHGADPNLADTDGQTALHKASAEGRSDILQLLLKHNGNPNLPDKQKQTALEEARDKGHPEIVQILEQASRVLVSQPHV